MALAIRDEVIEELLQDYRSPDDLLGEEGLFKAIIYLTQAGSSMLSPCLRS